MVCESKGCVADGTSALGRSDDRTSGELGRARHGQALSDLRRDPSQRNTRRHATAASSGTLIKVMRDERVDSPIWALELPTRLANFAERRGLTTVRDLLAIHPAALVVERNIGRKTVFETEKAIAAYLGKSWEAARESLGLADSPDAVTDADGGGVRQGVARRWNELRHVLPDRVLDAKLGRFLFPARLMNVAIERGATTVRDLVAIDYEQLHASGNLGRKTLADSLELLEAAQNKPPADPAAIHQRWLPLLNASLATLPADDRLVVAHRAGLCGPPPTLAELGERLGVSRERVRQREARANGLQADERCTTKSRMRSTWASRRFPRRIGGEP